MSKNDNLTPDRQEALIARAAMRELSRHASKEAPLNILVAGAGDAEPIAIPPGAVEHLIDILAGMASEHGGTNTDEGAELSVAQAADVLYTEPHFVIKILERNEIPYRMVGNHPRMRVHDVMNYRDVNKIKRRAVLDQLVAEAQEQDMGY